jgi:CPA2 family monovalent cation:H+ antiporter-2
LKVTSGFLYPIAVAVSAITTLLNPYLIKNADRFVSWFDRLAPPKLVSYLALYTQWVGQRQRTTCQRGDKIRRGAGANGVEWRW